MGRIQADALYAALDSLPENDNVSALPSANSSIGLFCFFPFMTSLTPTITTDLRWKPNVTVAAIIERDGRFLLVEEQTADGLRLNTPAGHLDFGESPLQACIRETLEETAYSFLPNALVGIYLSGAGDTNLANTTYLRFAFCGDLGALDSHRTLDTGIVRTLWLSPTELEATAQRHRSPMVLRSVHDFLAGKRYPLEIIHTA